MSNFATGATLIIGFFSIVILGSGIELGMFGDGGVTFDRGDADLDLSDGGVADLLLQFFSHKSGVMREPTTKR